MNKLKNIETVKRRRGQAGLIDLPIVSHANRRDMTMEFTSRLSEVNMKRE